MAVHKYRKNGFQSCFLVYFIVAKLGLAEKRKANFEMK